MPDRFRRVAPAAAEAAEAKVEKVEKALPNGDFYFGAFARGVPHGNGKYVWADGCVYDGEWRLGVASGRGRFSWPSGATFEGEFRGGRMDGRGVFVGPDGAAYSGGWSADRRHGRGAKRYPNGDAYDGQWRRGVQDGHGRYVWRSGNQYVGEWRAGTIHGRGALVWANGCRYDGVWENGAPKGTGVFTWPDGKRYICTWPGKGVDAKAAAVVAGTFFRAVEARGSGAEKAALCRRICIWESDGEAGDITCDIVGALEAPPDAVARRDFLEFRQRSRRGPCWLVPTPEGRRPGQTIDKEHKNYELMLNLQLGIRYSVGKSAAMPLRELTPMDFDPSEKFWTRFPSEGSKLTPPHTTAEFRWKDYCPVVFRHLRKLFAVDPADYMLAICGDDALRELSSPGKSGSCFYLTQDDRFMIKTVKKSEVKVLIRMLPGYYDHVSQSRNSLLTKFYGVHCVKPIGGQKVRFIVMGNLLCSEYQIHRRFDLKGSSYGRTADKFEEEIDETTTLKDLDLNFVFRFQRHWHEELHEQLMRDCEFLESMGIMDYSLLVGVHFRDDNFSDCASPKLSGKQGSFHGKGSISEACLIDRDIDANLDIRLGANIPAIAEHVSRRSEFDLFMLTDSGAATSSETYGVVLNFGIIDILQDYSITKKLEHAYKSLQTDPSSISAVDPQLYSARFQEFIRRIFIGDG